MIKNAISGHWESLCTSCFVDILRSVEIAEANVAGTKENLAMLVRNFFFIPSKMAILIFLTPNGEKFHLKLRILSLNSW